MWSFPAGFDLLTSSIRYLPESNSLFLYWSAMDLIPSVPPIPYLSLLLSLISPHCLVFESSTSYFSVAVHCFLAVLKAILSLHSTCCFYRVYQYLGLDVCRWQVCNCIPSSSPLRSFPQKYTLSPWAKWTYIPFSLHRLLSPSTHVHSIRHLNIGRRDFPRARCNLIKSIVSQRGLLLL